MATTWSSTSGTQPWSNGKVGMSGGSYVGITQFKTAETDPPHLAAIAPDEALADIYNDAYAPGRDRVAVLRRPVPRRAGRRPGC